MSYRSLALLAMGGLVSGAGAMALSCSASSQGDDSSAADSGGGDSTMDGPMSDGTVLPDSSAGDAPVDAGVGDGSREDGDGALQKDAGPLARCSNVNGACDIVSQNCDAGQECVPVAAPDGGTTTRCVATAPSEHLPKGHTCCPSSAGNPCLPGLQCIGETCDDAGNGGGRCAPACCIYPDGGADDTPCGSSVPEGFPGRCDLNIVDSRDTQYTLYAVCTYDQVCVPLHVQPCAKDYVCLVKDPQGSADCVQLFGDAGLGAHRPCSFANECADGLACLINPMTDAGTCLWMCYVQGQKTPFDAGILDGAPGYGGCPSGEQCFSVGGFPNWLGACQQ